MPRPGENRSRRVHGIDVAQIEQAIRQAESRTSAELRVAVARFYFWGDVHRAARATWRRLRMSATSRRTGVLLFVAPRRRRFVLMGDVAIEAKVPASFWSDIALTITEEIARAQLSAALVRGIEAIALGLAPLFPPDRPDRNELPDDVAIARS